MLIELYKVILTVIVCLHHLRAVSDAMPYGGAITATDGFYIVSGIFLMFGVHRSIELDRWKSIGRYAVDRYKRLIFSFLLAYVIALFSKVVLLHEPIKGSIAGIIAEPLLCEIYANEAGVRIIAPDWYLGYLLIGQVIIYSLLFFLARHRSIAIVIRVITVVAGYAYLGLTYGQMCIFPQRTGWLDPDVLVRAVCGIVLGTLIVDCCIKVEHIAEKRAVCTVLAVVASCIAVVMLGYMVFGSGWNSFDFPMLVMATILLVILYILSLRITGEGVISRLIMWFGSISFAVYLNHYTIVHYFEERHLIDNWDWKVISVVMTVVIYIFSVAVFYIQNYLEKGIKKALSHKADV